MKTAWSHLGVLILCFCVTLYAATSFAGVSVGFGGTAMVICSDAGAKTVVIDADGNPVSPLAPCCDCLSCTAPTTAFPCEAFRAQAAPNRFSRLAVLRAHQTPAPIIIARAQARGPPLTTLKHGACAVLHYGRVCQDTTA